MNKASGWQQADLPLALLVALATIAAMLLLSSSENGLEAVFALVVTVCRRTLEETLAHGADLGRLTLLLTLGVGFTLAAAEALRLALVTRRLINGLSLVAATPTEHLARLRQKCGIACTIKVVGIEGPMAFTQGVFDMHVWLSTGLIKILDEDELEAVLRHEMPHVRMHDPLKILCARCLARGLFFVPLGRDLLRAYMIAKEIAADQGAARGMGSSLPLIGALRKLMQALPKGSSTAARARGFGLEIIGDRISLETRLLALISPSPRLRLFRMARIGLSVLG